MLNIPEEVKIALRAGDRRKNYKMKVNDVDPDTGERTYSFTIDNNSIVKESVRIDERMATGKYLKFGLCEGASLEFQYFDHPNINGKDIQVFISIEYVDSNDELAWYDIPMGWFSVDQCPMQWDTGIFKVTAYNKLKSAYLDQKCNTMLDESINDPTIQVSVIGLRNYFLSDFEVKPYGNALSPDMWWHDSNSTRSMDMTITNKTDVNTPINYYNSGVSDSDRVCALWIQAEAYIYTVDPNNYYQFIEIARKYYDCQLSFINYLSNMIDNSPVDVSGEDVWESLNTSTTWQSCFSIKLIDANNVAKYYSDYAYKNGISGIDGTVNDLIKMLITGVSKIEIYIPKNFKIAPRRQFYTAKYVGRLNGATDIQYEIDSSHSTATYPVLKYPDGAYIPLITDDHDPMVYRDWFNVYDVENLNPADLIVLEPDTMPDFTLRDLISASYETVAQYGKLDRETDLFDGVELNQGGLYPQDTLYPADSLYPQGNALHPFPSSYSKLWTDTVGEQSFRYLIITYKTIVDGEETDRTLQRTVNTHGTTNYNMSDNWLFRNLVWTAEDVGTYADAMVEKMRDIRWFPFELWGAGLPHIETGDAIEITDKNGDTHTSYVLTRTLSGVQDLQDTFINGELDIF